MDGGEGAVYPTPVEEFELSRVDLRANSANAAAPASLSRIPAGPEIWLVTEGHFRLTWPSGSLELPQGASAFIPADLPRYGFSGVGTLFGAKVPARR